MNSADSANRAKNIIECFGKNVFDDRIMQTKLPADIYKKLKKTIENGDALDYSVAVVVAEAMKDWAIENGATHYTHWFQPLSGVTAEKHDSFISAPKNGEIILEFSASALTKGEPDASSFPSGGLRATFEARGYTTWDCTSPVFLRKDELGVTLCIPTAFCSYKGEALDKKTPLLRSIQALDKQGIRILRLLGNNTSKNVTASVGAEQEYFLIDKSKYLQRKDLIYTGRTLVGAMPPKGQEMDDHYFGTIKPRVAAFMQDLNWELWSLGIPAKTQHNEVAPSQHELAPVFEQANIAVDHNQLTMEIMKSIANKHNLACLLHEKPFAGLNGSGKHNNWSLNTDDGIKLLRPGHNPHKNIQFLLILACVLKAVDEYADLLRESAAVVGNDHRLGANEAPPAIISVFLGEQLEDVIKQICEQGFATYSKQGGRLEIGVNTIVNFEKDATDRNRTSPFAFTNNKFEFRMVGSSSSVATSTIVLNTAVANSFKFVADRLEEYIKTGQDLEQEIKSVIRELFIKHQRIIFSGNGYTEAWLKEAESRGLPNIASTVEAIGVLTLPKNVELFEKFGVFTKTELLAREAISYEAYGKTINIEAKTLIDIVSKSIIPAVINYKGKVAGTLNHLRQTLPNVEHSIEEEILLKIIDLLREVKFSLDELVEAVEAENNINSYKERAFFCSQVIVPIMNGLRKPIDALEMIVDKDCWPMPSYGDLVFDI